MILNKSVNDDERYDTTHFTAVQIFRIPNDQLLHKHVEFVFIQAALKAESRWCKGYQYHACIRK